MNQSESDTEALLTFLKNAALKPGDKLPPERELSAELGMSRTRLRAALDQLDNGKLLWRHVGKGTFLGARPRTEFRAAALEDLANPQAIMEARLAVEPMLARLAATRASPSQIATMQDCVDRMASQTDPDEFHRNDRLFHELISEAAGNDLMYHLYGLIREYADRDIWRRLRDVYMTPERIAEATGHHRDLIDSIRQRDPTRAERDMRLHVESVRQRIFGA